MDAIDFLSGRLLDAGVFKRGMARALLAGTLLAAAGLAQAGLPIQHWQSPSGARVYFVENHALPILDVSVNFAAGSSRDAPHTAGVAVLTRSLLALGADGLTDDQISGRFADLGAQLGGEFDLDRAGFKLRTLSSVSERDSALGLFALVLQRPDFPAAVLEREKARVIAGLREAATQPESIADRAFVRALYGSHPYVREALMAPETVADITRNDLLEFYRQHYTRAGAVIAIIGDVSRTEAEAIAATLSAGLPPGGVPQAVPPAPLPVAPEEVRLPHPATQSHILLGYPGIKRGDPDYFPLYVGNYILGGGGFVSRLTEEVREKRGLAYSVYSYFLPLQEAGPFQVGLQTKREQAGAALALVRDTLRRFVERGPDRAELKAAQDNLTGGFPLRIDSNSKILDYLSVIGFYRLPLTYLEDFNRQVSAVTVAQVRDAFRRRIVLDNMVTVIVGDGT